MQAAVSMCDMYVSDSRSSRVARSRQYTVIHLLAALLHTEYIHTYVHTYK